MAARVDIPGEWRLRAEGRSELEGEGADVGELIARLDLRFPGLRDRLLDEKGDLRRHVAVFVNDQDVRSRQGLSTRLSDGDRVAFLPAIAGG